MTQSTQIPIAAFVSESEHASVDLAADHIARVLSETAATPWTCDCAFSPDLESLGKSSAAKIIVTSLLPELKKIDEPWSEVEPRLRKAYATLCDRGIPVFICTILRHVTSEAEPDVAALRVRIRQLNLLAAEISRETGAYVVDIDRVIADIGARRFETDYRLEGKAASEMAAHFLALTLIGNGFEDIVAYEIQEAATTILESNRPAIAEPDGSKPEVTLRKDYVALGKGRRKQVVFPVQYTVQENYSGWLVRQVLRGAIGPGEALNRLVQAVRRRGVWESSVMLASGLSRQIKRNK